MSNNQRGSEFTSVFGMGIGGWVAASLALFASAWFLEKPETISSAVLWVIQYWWVAFAFGLVLLVGYGLKAHRPIMRAALAYLLPALVIFIFASICYAVFPDGGFLGDLRIFLPIVGVFSLFGFLWTQLKKSETVGEKFARAVIPPIVGGLMMLAFVAAPVFGSPAFVYRNAFGFTIGKMDQRPDKLVVDAALEIHKAGDYQFSVTRYDYSEMTRQFSDFDGSTKGTILWGASGEPKSGATGSFPMQISWPTPAANTKEQIPVPPEYGMSNQVILEVRERSGAGTMLQTIASPLPGTAAAH